MSEKRPSADLMATPTLQSLYGHRYIALTTYRGSGQPVTTPVWFVAEGDRLWICTDFDSGKAKRLQRNARVRLAPSTANGQPLGPALDGRARFLERAEWPPVQRALRAKYSWQAWLFGLLGQLRRQPATYIEIEAE